MGKHQVALCVGCRWAAGCTIPSDSYEPVLTCGTFEHLDGRLLDQDCEEQSRPDPSRAHGLCGDCGNADTCVFRNREGGTWHCEEYS